MIPKRIISSFFVFTLIVFSALNLKAQDHDIYEGALGIRAGVKPGVSLKWFTGEATAFEAIGQFPYNGYQVTLLYERHFQAFSTPRLHWFLGIGGHIGAFDSGNLQDPDGNIYNNNVTTFGLDAIAGIEYAFEEVPFTLGVDVKPFIDLINPGPDYLHSAFTIRYYW